METVTCLVLAAALVPIVAQHANASGYPLRPVRMVVPLAPEGGSDIVGRSVAHGLTERWGQSVVVDNRPSAGTAVGTSITAKAPADGYTLLALAAASPETFRTRPPASAARHTWAPSS